MIPAGYHDLMEELSSLNESGISIHFVLGNHDYWDYGYLKKTANIIFHKNDISYLSYCQFTEINDKKIRIIILPLKQGIIPKSINCSDAILNRNIGAANSNITYLTVENNGTIEPETSFSETILNLNSSNDRQLSPINTRLQFLKLNENEKKQLCLLNIYKIPVNLKNNNSNKNVISYLIRPNQNLYLFLIDGFCLS